MNTTTIGTWSRRLAVLTLVGVTGLAASRCGDETAATEILLSITSEVDVDTVEISARNIEYDSDVISRSVTDRDLTTEPLLILISPSTSGAEIAPTGDVGFLIQARGIVNGQPVVARSKILTFRKHRRTEESLQMLGIASLNDADGDGFPSCVTNPSDELCDCVDQNSQINHFTVEVCGDDVDNNCSGYPPDEGCPCAVPKPCTNLPENLRHLLGNGRCAVGELQCVDGTLSTTCTFPTLPDGTPGDGRPADAEIADNEIDDDCDGFVDEGSSCTTGESRPCLMGWVGQEAVNRALGECRTGTQNCVGGEWEANCSAEEVRPTPAPDGVGYAELPDPNVPGTTPTDFCDGYDNDCDGLYDEEGAFDADRDGFTICGTCIDDTYFGLDPLDNRRMIPATLPDGSLDPRRFLGRVDGELCPQHIDCEDGIPEMRPLQAEDCRTEFDDDCRCDHGANIGEPSIIGPGMANCPSDGSPNCLADDCLRCDRDGPRADVTAIGRCDDSTMGTPYYFDFYPDRQTGDCHFCAGEYGRGCDPDRGVCTTRAQDCADCTNGIIAETREQCMVPQNGTCDDTIAPVFDPIGLGTDDPIMPCPGKTCDNVGADGGPYYHGISGDPARCYYHADVPGVCDGAGQCRTRREECLDAPAGVPIPERTAPPSGLPYRRICQFPSGGCSGETQPSFGNVARSEDPYSDCPGTCDGAGACHAQQGESCVSPARLCEEGLTCVDGVCCASATCATCQACNLSGSEGQCAAVTAPEGRGCNDDCSHCVAGSCDARVAGDFAECGGECQACTTAGGDCGNWTGTAGTGCNAQSTYCCDGTCVDPPPADSEYDTSCGTGDCAGGTWGCNGTAPLCSSWNNPCDYCNGDRRRDAVCTSGLGAACNTTSATTTNCGACNSCRDDGTTTVCVPLGGVNDYGAMIDDNNDPNRCSGSQTCDGSGQCKLDDGQTCGSDGTLCASGFCVDGVCCEASTCGECERCDVGTSLGQCTGINANEGRNCTGPCSSCVAGVCTDRLRGAFAECSGVCLACDAPGGSCADWTGASGSSCTGGSTYCCSGTCVDPSGASTEYGGSCGDANCGNGSGTWGCNGTTARCSNYGDPCDYCTGDTRYDATCTSNFGASCGTGSGTDCNACLRCTDSGTTATCEPYGQGVSDTTAPNTCSGNNACDGSGGCKLDDGQDCSTGGAAACASGHCVDGVCCATSTCGECERCDTGGNEGTCQPITAANGRNCNDDCTRCNAGTCVNRPQGAFNECTGECQACNAAGGDCANYTGADASSCTGTDTFCCGGSCVNPSGSPSEYNGSCGSGDCAGGNWGCNGTTAECNTRGDNCGNCSAGTDSTVNGTCQADGTCSNATTADCPACRRCLDGPSGATCGTNYGPDVDDTTNPNQCTGTNTCNGGGLCKLQDGESCGSDGTLCASGFCVDGVCCATAVCGTCESCAPSGTCTDISGNEGSGCTGPCTYCNSGVCADRAAGDYNECINECEACDGPGSSGGTCAAHTGTDGPACTAAGRFCCSGTCANVGGGEEYGGTCGTGVCQDTWTCNGTAPQCGTNLSRECDTCSGDTIDHGTCSGNNGTTCAAGSSQDCAQCMECTPDGGGTGSATCEPYGQGVDDTTNPNTCGPNLVCDGTGACLSENGQNCTSNPDCAYICVNTAGGANQGTCMVRQSQDGPCDETPDCVASLTCQSQTCLP